MATEGATCEADGLVGRSPDGQLLVCHGARWQGAGSGFGGAFGWDDILGCDLPMYRSMMINPKTGTCSCPPGFAPFEVSRTDMVPGHHRHSFHSFVCIR